MALTVEIDQLVTSLGNVKFIQPIIECITNSLESNSTKIIVDLISSIREGTSIEDDWFIKEVIIQDDGDGFNTKNYKAFKEYKTKNKIKIGCKGIGRLTWLKIFKKAEISSVLKERRAVIKKWFVFDEAFDYKSKPQIDKMPNNTNHNQTTIRLFDLANEDLSIPEDLEKLRNDVYVELLPKLILLNRDFSIEFKSCHPGVPIQSITPSDLPELQSIKFDITFDLQNEPFTLRYFLSHGNGQQANHNITHAYHCANNRAVESFSNNGLSINISNDNQYGIFLLQSELFDKRVNDARNKIDIDKDASSDTKISWEIINDSLRPILMKLINTKWPSLAEQAKKDKDKLAEENPHLAAYIRKFNVVGCLENKEALKNAEKHFESAKKHVKQKYKELLLRHNVKESNIQEFQKLAENTTELGKQELAEYIWYRKVIVDVMEKLIEIKTDQEKYIHNIIMPLKTTDKERVEDNNLWLLDDKFSLYQYAASDMEIKQIYEDVCGVSIPRDNISDCDDRPDLCIFFSDSKKSNDDLEAVIIELKSFASDKYDKGKGLDQLGLYADSFARRNPKFKKFWVYLIVDDIDEDFRRLLTKSRHWKRFFCHDGEVYLEYNQENNAHFAVITAKALAANAKARNNKFLEIVKSGMPKSDENNDIIAVEQEKEKTV